MPRKQVEVLTHIRMLPTHAAQPVEARLDACIQRASVVAGCGEGAQRQPNVSLDDGFSYVRMDI